MKKLFKRIALFIKVFRIRKRIKKIDRIDEIVKDKFNFLGSSAYKKGLKLYSFDPMTEVVTEVPLLAHDEGNFRGFISPSHSLVWALNYKNAKRKFDGNKSSKVVV